MEFISISYVVLFVTRNNYFSLKEKYLFEFELEITKNIKNIY